MDKKSVGARFANLRKAFDLTQRELADALKLRSKGQISNYESGDNYPPFELVDEMGKLLGVDAFAELTKGETPDVIGEDGTRRLPGHVSIPMLRGFSRSPGSMMAIFPEDVLRRRMPGADLDVIRWIVNPSDAMSPRFMEGATAFVDPRVNSLDQVINGQVYAFHVFGNPDVRRIFVIGPNEFRLTGANENENRLDLTGPDYKRIQIFGRVIDAI